MQLLTLINRLINGLFGVIAGLAIVTVLAIPLITIALGATGAFPAWRPHAVYNSIVLLLPYLGGVVAWRTQTKALRQGRYNAEQAKRVGTALAAGALGIGGGASVVIYLFVALAGGDGGFSDAAYDSVNATCASLILWSFWLGLGFLYYPLYQFWAQRALAWAKLQAQLQQPARYATWGVLAGLAGVFIIAAISASSSSGIRQPPSTTTKVVGMTLGGVLLFKALYYAMLWLNRPRPGVGQ